MPETANTDNKNLGNKNSGNKSSRQQDVTDLGSEFEFDAVPVKAAIQPDYGRRIRLLMGTIIFAVIAYTIGWFVLGNYIENQVRTVAQSKSLGCTDVNAMGYPFRMGISCSNISVPLDTKSGKAIIEGINFRTAAQVYQPSLLIAEVDSPLTFTHANTPPLTLNYQSARASVRANTVLPSRISITVALPDLTGLPAPITANDFQLHMRKGEANLIELASGMTQIKAGDAPVAELTFDAAIAGASRVESALQNNGDVRQAILGSEGELRDLTLSFGGQGKLRFSGPFTISENGLLNGEMAIAIENGADLGPAIASLLKSFGAEIPAIGNMLAGAGGGNANLTVTIRNGAATIGFIPLGQIPPL